MGKLAKARQREERKRIARIAGMSSHPNEVLGKTRKVLIYDPLVYEFPELYLDVYVAGDSHEERNFAEMLARSRCNRMDRPEDADVVIFTGGPDVNPELYGEEAHPNTYFNVKRDEADLLLYDKCYDLGIPMMGVCRGAQFLHVMNGGKLYQHVDGHNSPHSIWDVFSNRVLSRVSSVHHQMVIKNNHMKVIATSHAAQNRWIDAKTCIKGNDADVEAFFYRDTCCFGVQGHPEYSDFTEYTIWTLKRMNEFFIENPDVYMTEKRVRRLKDDIISLRTVFDRDTPPLTEEEVAAANLDSDTINLPYVSPPDEILDLEDTMIAAYGAVKEENA